MRLRLPVFLLLPSAYAAVTVTVHTTIHTTLGAAATPTPPSTEYTSPRAFQRAILDTHNFYRKEHNASALAWNMTSAAYAADWAEACQFEHSVSIDPFNTLYLERNIKTAANKQTPGRPNRREPRRRLPKRHILHRRLGHRALLVRFQKSRIQPRDRSLHAGCLEGYDHCGMWKEGV